MYNDWSTWIALCRYDWAWDAWSFPGGSRQRCLYRSAELSIKGRSISHTAEITSQDRVVRIIVLGAVGEDKRRNCTRIIRCSSQKSVTISMISNAEEIGVVESVEILQSAVERKLLEE